MGLLLYPLPSGVATLRVLCQSEHIRRQPNWGSDSAGGRPTGRCSSVSAVDVCHDAGCPGNHPRRTLVNSGTLPFRIPVRSFR